MHNAGVNKGQSKLMKNRKAIRMIIAVIALILFLNWQNNDIVVSEYIYSNNVESDLDGYTIVQVSDLHTKVFGNDNHILVEKITECNPDLIAITGDYADTDKYESAIILAEKLVDIAPTYYVTGNHEVGFNEPLYAAFEEDMINAGVNIMYNTCEKIYDDLYIMGLDDREIKYGEDVIKKDIQSLVEEMAVPEDAITILLAHEPQYLESYAQTGIDMILSGHAHGGQIRVPFTDISLCAPGQGFFPKYSSGQHTVNDTTMYISRGLGNSILPFRIFNRPELVKIVLKAE